MSGTKEGGAKVRATVYRLYGRDFYKRIGAMTHASWVANGRKPRGFATDRVLASRAGKIGGAKGRRGKHKTGYKGLAKEITNEKD